MADTFSYDNNIGLLIWRNSNFWQSNLRKILRPFKLSLNEFLILKSVKVLSNNKSNIFQNEISILIGIDISVVSVNLKNLESKKYISRSMVSDNRKKIIKLLVDGDLLINKVNPLILDQENILFNKLNNETFNFTNSLKLLLGKKIRIKAN